MSHRAVPLAVIAVLILLIPAGAVIAQEDWEPVIQSSGIRSLVGGTTFAYHPESQRLATAHYGEALLWDTRTGLIISRFLGGWTETPYPSVRSLEFSPDGTRLLIAGNSHIRLHDVQSGGVAVNFVVDWSNLGSAIFSPDGRHVAAVQGDRSIAIWDAVSGARRQTLGAHPHLVGHVGHANNLRFSPDGTKLLSGGDDRQAILWDIETGEVLQRFYTPTSVVQTDFRADGKQLLTMGAGGLGYSTHIIVWDVETGRPLRSLSPATPRAPFVGRGWFVGDDIHLLQPNGEHQRISPDCQVLPPIPEAPPPSGSPGRNRTSVAISHDHWMLRVQGTSPVAALHSPSGEVVPLPNPRFDALAQDPLDFSPDQRWLATGGGRDWRDNKIVVWDLENGRQAGEFVSGKLARFHPDNQRLLISSWGQLSLFDIQSGEIVQTYESEKVEYTSLQFVAGGKQILTSTGNWYDGDGGQILLWDTETGELIRDYAKSDKAVLHARMTPDETEIVASLTIGDAGSAGIDQITVFDAQTGDVLREVNGVLMGRSLDERGRFLVGLSSTWAGDRYQGSTFLRDVKTLELYSEIMGEPAAISRDAEVLACFNPPDRLSFWDTSTKKTLATRSTRLHLPRTSQFHPGGALYVGNTAESDAISMDYGPNSGIGFWDIASGELQAVLYTFQEDPDRQETQDWLITTSAGAVSGSEGGLARIAWRLRGTDQASLQPTRTQAAVDAQAVGAILSRSLPSGVSLRESLSDLMVQPVHAPRPRAPLVDDFFRVHVNQQRERAIQAFQEAGIRIERAIHAHDLTMVHMEGHPISDDLIAHFPWFRYMTRLYLADTGITDEQLKAIAMMGSVERMSLWGNPITDEGMAHLETLWGLKVLDIHDTAVTAEGLNQLRFLNNLETLIVPKNVDLEKITLRERLPNLEIIPR